MLESDSDDAADANVGSHSLQPQLPPTAGRAPPRDDEVRQPPPPAAAARRGGAAGPRGGGRLLGLVVEDSGGDARGNCMSVSVESKAARTARFKEELGWLVQILYSVFDDVAVSVCVCVCVSGSSRGVCSFVYVAIIVFDIFSFCTRTFCFLD